MSIEFSEKDLLKRLGTNDKAAAETIYKSNFGMVQSFIIGNNGSSDDAKDVFQEAMIVLYENAKSPSFELSCLIKTYVYSVARRLWLKKLQQAKKFTGDIDNVAETIPVEEEIEVHEQKNNDFKHMESAMMNLGEPCKSLLEAYYIGKKNMTDIAGSFGYTNADNAKNQKYKCLMRLKKIFFAQYKNNTI
ncbi:MAG: sigma-70 family RNA polymerase sigma factor [Chitinophagaceae bacterium]